MHLILASQSPRRRELLALTGLDFEVLPALTDEQQQPGEMPEDYVVRLSRDKAFSTRSEQPETVILAADTIVVDRDEVLGKPENAAQACRMLTQLRGRTHIVYTAVTVLAATTGKHKAQIVGSPVTMRHYSDQEIADYIATGDPFDKAGGYAIQNSGFRPVNRFDHCFANVMGLPLCHVAVLLKPYGMTVNNGIATACQQHLSYRCPVYGAILNI
nr:septum formation protein Maf [Anaerolineae bacterium]